MKKNTSLSLSFSFCKNKREERWFVSCNNRWSSSPFIESHRLRKIWWNRYATLRFCVWRGFHRRGKAWERRASRRIITRPDHGWLNVSVSRLILLSVFCIESKVNTSRHVIASRFLSWCLAPMSRRLIVALLRELICRYTYVYWIDGKICNIRLWPC